MRLDERRKFVVARLSRVRAADAKVVVVVVVVVVVEDEEEEELFVAPR